MSRMYNNFAEHRFEVFGEEYDLVEPESLVDLVEALRVRDALQEGIDATEPDSGHNYYALRRLQNDWIDEYIVSLGEFDNTMLARNINYLCKKNNIRIGDLERILGISTGYISRTAKEKSGKRMSIDIAWRIARIFSVTLTALIETDLQVPNQNTALVSQFLDKLKARTERNDIEWENLGGPMCKFDRRLAGMEIFQEESDDVVYRPAHLNSERRFSRADDVYACKGVDPEGLLIMVAYSMDERESSYHIDFYFLRPNNRVNQRWRLDKAFSTIDDRSGQLDRLAGDLMSLVQTQEMDTKITPEVRNVLKNFLN